MPEPWEAYAEWSEGPNFADWCRAACFQSVDEWTGKPLELEPWQLDIMGEAFAVKDDKPFWRGVLIVLPRKNGKTHLLAAVALYRLMFMGGRPEILLAASSDKQAGRLFDAAAWFVRSNPDGAFGDLRVREMAGEILNHETGGKILRMSSDAKTLHGYSPSLVICDELAQWSTPSLRRAFGALTTGGAARSAPQTFIITTAGNAAERETGLLGEMMNKQVATGAVEQPYTELTIGRHFKSSRMMYAWEAQTEDKADIAAIKRANPASWITEEYLSEQATNPEVSDSDFWQLHANVWAAQDDVWIRPAAWDACADPDLVFQGGSTMALGVDGSRSHDTTVVAWAVPLEDGAVGVGCRIFSVREDSPHHVLHHGKIDYDDVEGFIVDRFEEYDVVETAYDPRFFHRSAELIDRRLPESCIFPVEPQSKHMREALTAFERLISQGKLRHAGDTRVAAHLANARVERGQTMNELRRVVKIEQTKPIDAVIAMALAVWRADVGDMADAAPLVGFV